MAKQYNYNKETKIKCCYCDIRHKCKFRQRKENVEKLGVMTKCMLTPNRPGKNKNSRKT